MEIFFVADDFGATAEFNRAMVKSHRDGALNGASLMMGQAGTGDAVALARENPSLKIGWHLHLCDSRPVTCEEWPWRGAPVRAGFQIALSRPARELMRREVQTQWDLFQATGLPCEFVNSHHHLHTHPLVYRYLLEVLPLSFSGWIRLGQPRFFGNGPIGLSNRALGMLMRRHRRNCRGLRASQTLWGIDRTFRMDAGEVIEAARSLPDGLHEFIFHPRRTESDQDLAALIELKTNQGVTKGQENKMD